MNFVLIALGAASIVYATIVFFLRSKLQRGRKAGMESIGLAKASPLEPKSPLGYALVRCIPIVIVGVGFLSFGLFGRL